MATIDGKKEMPDCIRSIKLGGAALLAIDEMSAKYELKSVKKIIEF